MSVCQRTLDVSMQAALCEQPRDKIAGGVLAPEQGVLAEFYEL